MDNLDRIRRIAEGLAQGGLSFGPMILELCDRVQNEDIRPLSETVVALAAENRRLRADSFDGVISEYLAWSLRQFPDSTPASVAAHIRKEVLEELVPNPESAEELADIVALAFHSAARQGHNLTATLAAKIPILKARKWAEPDADGVVEHVRD